MWKIVEKFSFTKINLYINIIVILFIYIFLKPTTSEFTIKAKNYHTHCIRDERTVKVINEENEYVDLEEDGDVVVHTHRPEYNRVGVHSHTMNDELVRKPLPALYYDKDNIYSARYDRHLEYMLKGIVIVVVLISTVAINRALP